MSYSFFESIKNSIGMSFNDSAAMEMEIKQLEIEKAQMQKQLDAKDKFIEDLRSKYLDLENRNLFLGTKLKCRRTTIKELQTQVEYLKQKDQNVHQRLKDLFETVSTGKRTREESEDDFDSLPAPKSQKIKQEPIEKYSTLAVNSQ